MLYEVITELPAREVLHVVQVTEVHTKDGMFNAYINDLNNVWRKFRNNFV